MQIQKEEASSVLAVAGEGGGQLACLEILPFSLLAALSSLRWLQGNLPPRLRETFATPQAGIITGKPRVLVGKTPQSNTGAPVG